MPRARTAALRLTRLTVLTLVAVPLALSLLCAPASATTAQAETSARAAAAKVDAARRIALRQIGDRYQYGAEGPHRFDCSGLVFFSTRHAGLRVPRTSSAQARFMRRIGRNAMRPGDFVFFTGGSGVYHVGVYLGRRDGRRIMVHAPSPGTKVRKDAVWGNRWFAGTLRGR